MTEILWEEETAAIGSGREAYREGDLRELKTQIHTTRNSKLQTYEGRGERVLHRDEVKWEKPTGFSIHNSYHVCTSGIDVT